ncbi:hypothetical protein [Aeromicrobium sp.]|uniref:hypothetical protein n=1 Tax=Aeromicrobium sp. TaxID=1871063 RepID=UPI002FC8332A
MAGRKITIEFLGKDSTSGLVSAVEKRFGKLGSRLDRVGQRAGKALAGGFAVAGVAAYKLGQQASDLAETQSKVAQVFGAESTAALNKFAAGAAASMGQSKQTALDGAATFGIIGKSAGLAGKELVGFSTDMVKLAGDMASFNNSSPEEAIEAIGAGMRGEAEPLRRFGVLLDDATLKAEAMSIGLLKPSKNKAQITAAQVAVSEGQRKVNAAIAEFGPKSLEARKAQAALGLSQDRLKKATTGSIGPLTQQQKALAAQSAIMKQTGDQQGDFARTSDGLANKQRVLKAQLENMGTAIGEKVLPAMVKLSEVGLKMIDWVDRNQTTVKVLVGVVGTLGAGLYLASAAMRVMTMATNAQELAAKRAAAGHASFGASSLAVRGGALAAAAGLGVLAAKSGGAETSMGGLATVGAGVAAGFAVGGPWGAAIGGAGGLLAVFSKRGDAAAASQARMKAAVGTVTATLDAQTGAMTKLTRSTVAKTLADTGAFTAGNKVGLSYKTVLDAALGSEKATKKVDAATRAYMKTNMGSIGEVQKAAKVTQKLTGAVHGTTGAIADERKKIDQVNSAMGKLNGKEAKLKIHADTQAAFNKLYAIQRYINGMNGKTVRVAVSGSIGGISGNAKGTDNWRGGLTWVGEEGPEIVNLPKGSQVIPNHKTEQYMASHAPSGGSVMTASRGGVSSLPPLVVQLMLDGKMVAQSLVKFERDSGRPIGLRT